MCQALSWGPNSLLFTMLDYVGTPRLRSKRGTRRLCDSDFGVVRISISSLRSAIEETVELGGIHECVTV
jgi:hypothetical protein